MDTWTLLVYGAKQQKLKVLIYDIVHLSFGERSDYLSTSGRLALTEKNSFYT